MVEMKTTMCISHLVYVLNKYDLTKENIGKGHFNNTHKIHKDSYKNSYMVETVHSIEKVILKSTESLLINFFLPTRRSQHDVR